MEELLILLLQFLFEFLLNILVYGPIDLYFPDTANSTSGRITLNCCISFALGCVGAAISLYFFHHTFISVAALRIVNLILAPVASAFIFQATAKRRAETNEDIIPRHHFWQAFWFTLAFVAVRFAYVSRV